MTADGLTREALDAATSGAVPTIAHAEALLRSRGDDLDALLEAASGVRDAGTAADGRPGVVTYSKKVFIPVTTLCRDRCHYCIFVDTPGKLARKGKAPFLTPAQIVDVAAQGAAMGCKEALFTLGDRPERRWPIAREWLDEAGYASTLDYVQAMGRLVLDETGLLPHFNPGVMTWNEMQRLRPHAPSMGMMLETTSRAIWEQRGGAHFGSPDKDPAVRLRVLEDAGRSRIPFTTGVLLGIGETMRDRAEALFAIRDSHARWGHVQEVIVQNFRVKPATAMQGAPDLGTEEFVAAVAVARLVMGPDAHIQAPPNLTDAEELHLLVRAGIDDWGGVSPLTPDHVNPERPWPQIDDLARLTADAGHTLRERLTVYARHVDDEWIDPSLLPRVRELSTTISADATTAPTAHATTAVHVGDAALLARVERTPSTLTDGDWAALLEARGATLDALCSIADARRADVAPALTFVANRNVDASRLDVATLEAIETATAEAWRLGATEVCVQGAPPLSASPSALHDVVDAVRRGAHGMHVHAFRVDEIIGGAERRGTTPATLLGELRERGLGSISGSGARILRDDQRALLSGGTAPTVAQWTSVVVDAHRQGLPSSATVTYGHVETSADIVAHLRAIAAIQDDTGGFTELVPLPFLRADLPALADRVPRRRPSIAASRAVHAVARLLLAGRIDHVQAAWPKLGIDGATAMLRSGADDLGGLLMPGTSPDLGGEAGRWLDVRDVETVADALGRPIRQRTTTYGTIDAASARPILPTPDGGVLPEVLAS